MKMLLQRKPLRLINCFYKQAVTIADPDAIGWRSITSFGLKVVSVALSFATSLLLARTLNADGYGIYVYAAAWANLLVGPATLGFDRLLVRQVAVYNTESAWSRMRGLLSQARRLTFLSSLGLTVAAGVVVWLVVSPGDWQLRATLWLSLLSVPLLALGMLQQGTAQGLKHVVLGQLPTMLVRPVLFIPLIIALYLVRGGALSPTQVMIVSGVVTVLSLAISQKILQKIIPAEVNSAPIDKTESWIRHALPLLWLGMLYLLNSQLDVLILGTIRTPSEVAVYNVANRTADLVTFALLAVSVTIAPTIAELWARGEREQLQRVARTSVGVIAAVSVPLAIALIVAAPMILALFGPQFAPGYRPLAILTAGQLVNALTGPVSLLLVMTNHERDVIIGHGLWLVSVLVLSSALIPWWGIEGAAVARFCGLILWNIFLAFRVRSRLGINPTALAWLRAG